MGDTIHTGENVIMDLERNEVQITGPGNVTLPVTFKIPLRQTAAATCRSPLSLTLDREEEEKGIITPPDFNQSRRRKANSETGSESVSTEPKGESAESQPGELRELGMEIKMAVEEKEGLFSGLCLARSWGLPESCLGLLLARSNAVLLTVNAVLAELSDQVFAGKGIHDFFG
ncbi:hypothetical protein M0R45_020513 [Rubus argutus]|uniref:Uncharacterized protein n=1 Tax=Rubus argutus TaxID=59490 RepID=A0AAW1X9H8_RUBAR